MTMAKEAARVRALLFSAILEWKIKRYWQLMKDVNEPPRR
jgi:hypothetical protein